MSEPFGENSTDVGILLHEKMEIFYIECIQIWYFYTVSGWNDHADAKNVVDFEIRPTD